MLVLQNQTRSEQRDNKVLQNKQGLNKENKPVISPKHSLWREEQAMEQSV